MRADVLRLDVSARRRSLAAYSAGMALYTLVIVALYPAFKSSTSLDDLLKSDSTVAALFGVTGSLTSPGGWLNGNIYANFFPLVMLLLTIGYGAAAIAGQDEDGTLCLVAALPVRRVTIVLEKVQAMALQAAVLSAVVAAFVVVGRSFDLTVTVGNVIATSASALLMGCAFGIVTMAVGAYTGARGTAIGVGAALASLAYLISSLAPVVSWVRPARYASLFYWSIGHDQITNGVGLWDWTVLVGVVLVALGAAVVAFRRLDIH
jgi:beta-exotoxin I transport system permease protein